MLKKSLILALASAGLLAFGAAQAQSAEPPSGEAPAAVQATTVTPEAPPAKKAHKATAKKHQKKHSKKHSKKAAKE